MKTTLFAVPNVCVSHTFLFRVCARSTEFVRLVDTFCFFCAEEPRKESILKMAEEKVLTSIQALSSTEEDLRRLQGILDKAVKEGLFDVSVADTVLSRLDGSVFTLAQVYAL